MSIRNLFWYITVTNFRSLLEFCTDLRLNDTIIYGLLPLDTCNKKGFEYWVTGRVLRYVVCEDAVCWNNESLLMNKLSKFPNQTVLHLSNIYWLQKATLVQILCCLYVWKCQSNHINLNIDLK